ncbi:MAG: phage portal protein [Bauldia litoralis]|uniref:phage portal protein n=1 Tax=Bauldia litoralis TaxID=665467 RepID=UPI003297A3F1
MDFLKRLVSRITKRSANDGVWDAAFTTYPSDIVEKAFLDNNKEWVFVAVDKIAKSVSSIHFKVMRAQKSGDDVEVFDGPLVDFLETPAENLTGKDFVYLNTVYKELTGNAFWEKEKRDNLRPLIPTLMRPVVHAGRISGFKYTEGVVERTIPVSKVLHDRYVDPRRPYWGVGKLEKIARWVDTSSYANEFLRLFFVNGAQFGGFIETEEETDTRIKLIKAGLANEHVGVNNAHKIAVLPKGSKFSAATANMSDMQFRELDEQYRDKILSGFGVPKTLVGFMTEVNRASAEASEYIFSKYTVKPAVEDLIEFLNVSIAPMFDETGQLYFAYDEFVPENIEAKLKERELALGKRPYKSVNEVRAEEGLAPIEGGDDVPEPQAPATLPPGDKTIKATEKRAKALPKRFRSQVRKEAFIDDILARATEVATEHIDPDEHAHKKFTGRVDDHEKLIEDKTRDFNNRQEREVVENLARITKSVSKGDILDQASEIAIMVDMISPLLRGLMIEQAIEEYAAQGFEGSFDVENSSISRAVELAAKRMAQSYNDTTATLLKNALNDGIAAGDSLLQLTHRVREVYAFSDEVRAKALARTESFFIANEASKEAYRQSGVVKSIRWYTAEDERVCPYCGPIHGKVIGVNETFYKKGDVLQGEGESTLKLNYRAIDVPPLHTNCRCFIRPERIDIG